MELYSSNIKKFLIFSKKKALLIFWEMELSYIFGNGNPEKISYIFSKESFSCLLENGNPEKILYTSGNGTFLYFSFFIFFNL